MMQYLAELPWGEAIAIFQLEKVKLGYFYGYYFTISDVALLKEFKVDQKRFYID